MGPDKEFIRLVEMMARLRGPDGCPWDREQTSKTIAPYCLEEAHEVVEAIDGGEPEKLKDELGDLLLQVVFHAQMASEAGQFTIEEVCRTINDKLVRRHPHVFRRRKDDAVSSSDDVLKNWSKIKEKEGRANLLDGIPKALPALLKATRMGEKAASVGFDWENAQGVWAKVEEELQELKEAGSETGRFEDELGDLLFSLANLGRHMKVDAEGALRRASEKFERRFRWMEEESRRSGAELSKMSAGDLDALWNRSKRQ